MNQRQRKHKLNVARRKDVRWPWVPFMHFKMRMYPMEIGRVETFRFITSKEVV